MYSLTTSLITYIYLGSNFAISVFFGGLTVIINLAILTFFWNIIFSKKSIALAVFVIIFKYVILGMILWSLSTFGWFNIQGFLIGLAALVFSITIATLLKSYNIQKL